MQLIAGLGNPGKEYQLTRHNAGFMVVDRLVDVWDLTWALDSKHESLWCKTKNSQPQVILIKPQTYMNRSGFAIAQMVNYYKIDLKKLWLVHDDLDITLGEFKIQHNKGPKQHHGVDSVELQLGVKDFWRVRVGVDSRGQTAPTDSPRIPGEKYVLQKFANDELPRIESSVHQITQEIIRRLNGTI